MSTACSEEQRTREERNRKQHEYRARIRAQESSEQREERNKRQQEYQRDYRARRNTQTTAPPNAPDQPAAQYPTYGTTTSAVLQPINEGYFSAPNMNSIDVNMTPCTSIQGVHKSPFQTGNSRIFTGPTSVQDKENQTPCDASE
ncbi:unnamed protein product [Miscanthus lutarioriparius]|uniref:Uncharacterized protein n=1 Tax=Miscanthus lutarioriparius TaxID=422564 RepID=A0A811MBI3_9POAL|nr:unnamed protein product [Miscanthus lutarioriparius]